VTQDAALVTRYAVVGAIAFLAACGEHIAAPSPPILPSIVSASLITDSANVLSAYVSVHLAHADSVAAMYTSTDASAQTTTPAVRVAGDSALVPIFGLRAMTHYAVRIIAYGSGGNVPGNVFNLETGQLPLDLPAYTAGGSDPSPGFVVFAAGSYGIVIDNSGRVVWYHRFPHGPGLNFMAEPNGHYAARPTPPNPGPGDGWLEIDPLGKTVRTRVCAPGYVSRPHDLIIDSADGHWLLCDEVRVMDLSASGGLSDARVTGTVVQHIDKNGKLLFSWSVFDHFDITDGDPSARAGANVNWTHGNALDLDADGNLLVSFRNLSEIAKINTATGAVMWRLGGWRNQFVFVNSSAPAFAGQHGLRSAPGGLIILDNLGTPGDSRGELYTIDEKSMTATLARYYESTPGVVTQIGGSVQRLAGGRTLVSVGTAGRVEEYDANGNVAWRMGGNPGYIFRAQRISSLYTPGLGTAR
jgi:Arylsulfotransferase (ASST).